MIYREVIEVSTQGEGQIIDISSYVTRTVRASGILEGMVHVFVTGSTAAVTTIEYEEGVLSDLKRALSVLAPDAISYAHDGAWGDGNGRSHVKAAIVGPSLTLPVVEGSIAWGTWQQVVLLELDTRPSRKRSIIVTVHD